MVRRSEARNGFTLTEVLMALFVMAIGMISLLALFPAGYIQARWALDNEQVARGAANAQSMTEVPHTAVAFPGSNPIVLSSATSIRNDDNYRPETGNSSMCWQNCTLTPLAVAQVTASLGRDSYLKSAVSGTWTFNSNIYVGPPQDSSNLASPISPLPNARVKYPPVFVDPFIADNPAFKNMAVGLPFQVGILQKDDPALNRTPFAYQVPARLPVVTSYTNASLRPPFSVGLPRFSLSQYMRDLNAGASVPGFVLRIQGENAMSDEVDFGPNGQPNTVNNTTGIPSGQFAAQKRFTWGYMCQWFNYATPEVCDVTAVVFNSRPTNGGLASFPPGEDCYFGFPQSSLAAGIESGTGNFGRAFVKGLNQVVIRLDTAEASKAKAGDWILDNTMILPEYNSGFPLETAPFLDEYHPLATYLVSAAPVRTLRPGLVGGHLYKILDVSSVQVAAGTFYQTFTIDRPAKSDGFAACLMVGLADVITKGVGKMPQR